MALNQVSHKEVYVHQEYPKWITSNGKQVLVGTEEEELSLLGIKVRPDSLEVQTKRLTEFLSKNIPEEVKPDESSIDCAIRLLACALEPAESSSDEPGVEVGNSLLAPRRGRPPKAKTD